MISPVQLILFLATLNVSSGYDANLRQGLMRLVESLPESQQEKIVAVLYCNDAPEDALSALVQVVENPAIVKRFLRVEEGCHVIAKRSLMLTDGGKRAWISVHADLWKKLSEDPETESRLLAMCDFRPE